MGGGSGSVGGELFGVRMSWRTDTGTRPPLSRQRDHLAGRCSPPWEITLINVRIMAAESRCECFRAGFLGKRERVLVFAQVDRSCRLLHPDGWQPLPNMSTHVGSLPPSDHIGGRKWQGTPDMSAHIGLHLPSTLDWNYPQPLRQQEHRGHATVHAQALQQKRSHRDSAAIVGTLMHRPLMGLRRQSPLRTQNGPREHPRGPLRRQESSRPYAKPSASPIRRTAKATTQATTH